MSILKEMFNKVKAAIQKQSGSDVVVMRTIAVIIFIISLGLNYVLNYINGPTTNKNIYYNWEYIYSNQAAADDSVEWRSATYVNPISKEKTGDYIHLRTTFKASDKNRNIVIKTDHAPIKVSVNQKDVYNNWYNKAHYVGNNYNSITIPASNSDTIVRISIRLPLSPEIQISLNDNVAKSYLITLWNILSSIILIISIIGLLFSIVLLFTKYRKSFNFILALDLITFSVSAFLASLANATYLLNAPEFYGIYMCVIYISLSLLLVSLAKLFKISLKASILPLFLGLLASVSNILIHTPIIYEIALIIQYGMLFIASLILAKESRKIINIRIKNAKALNVIVVYLCISVIATLVIQLYNKYRIALGSFSFIYSIVALGFIIFCYVSSLYFDKEITKTEQKMYLYDECIEKIPLLIENITYERNMNQIYRCIAESICDICVTFLGNNENLDISYCVGIKTANGYEVIVNDKMSGTPDFNIIESRHYETKRSCIFFQTYFCLIFKNADDDIDSIIYFEGLEGTLSSFFVKVIEIVYTISSLIIHDKQNSSITENEQEIFVKLAKNVESATGSNETHADGVAKYMRLVLKEMGYPDSTCNLVSNAAALHDIGKIAVPTEITGKYDLLSDKERLIMNKHTEYGEKLLRSIDTEFMNIAAVIALEHHEYYNGGGYHKKSGEEINIYARIAAVADVFDALITKRSYKEAWSYADAVNYIKQNSGKKFDPKVVDAFENVISRLKEDISE